MLFAKAIKIKNPEVLAINQRYVVQNTPYFGYDDNVNTNSEETDTKRWPKAGIWTIKKYSYTGESDGLRVDAEVKTCQ